MNLAALRGVGGVFCAVVAAGVSAVCEGLLLVVAMKGVLPVKKGTVLVLRPSQR